MSEKKKKKGGGERKSKEKLRVRVKGGEREDLCSCLFPLQI